MKVLSLLLLAGLVQAGEYAVLDNGFRIPAQSHEVRGEVTCLLTEGGQIEVPTASVIRFEQEDYVPPAAVPEVFHEPPTLSPKELVDEAAQRYGLPPEILHSVAAIESSYRAGAVSPKGAIGVMQLMPGTARGLNADPHDLEQNVDAGARHLRDLLLKYDGGVFHALAAYNAGSGAVAKYGGIPPYRETQLYVEKVMRRYRESSKRTAKSTDD